MRVSDIKIYIKMRAFILLILTLVFSNIHAQKSLLHGTIRDKNDQVIDYANVLILSNDSTFIKGTVVNPQGYYSISMAPGEYIIHIRAIGLEEIFRKIILTKQDLQQNFYMNMDNYALNEVVVTSKSPLVRREADKIIFDGSQIAPSSNDALDILKNVPGVIVTNDEVSILGQQGVKILINGREQKMSSKEFIILLKSYQAEQVDKIEVMTTPSSKFDAEGSAGILNIKLKKARIDYMSTTINYAYSYDNYHTNTANANFIYNKNRFNILLNAYGNLGKSRYKERNQEEYESYNRKSSSNSISKNKIYNLRGNVDYQIDPKATVGALAYYNKNNSKSNMDGESGFYSKAAFQLDSLLLSENPNDVTNESYRVGMYSDIKIDTLGKKVHFDLDYLHSTFQSEKRFSSKTYNPSMDHIGGNYGFNNDNNRNINAVTSSVDFILPYNKYTINWGAKFSHAKTKNQIDYYNQPLLEEQNDVFFFTENIYALYAEVSKTFSRKLTFKSGLRLEHTYTKGEKSEKYTRLFPTLYLGYKPHKYHQFNLSLSSRISRPSFRNINPFVLYTNKYSTVSGKPDLKPAYTYKLNLGYTLKGNFSIDGFYSYKTNGFTQVQRADPSDLTIHTFWDNVLDTHTMGINNSYFFNKLNWMQIFLIHGINYEKSKSSSLYTIPTRNSLSYIVMINTSFFLNKEKTLTGWLNGSYSTPENLATTDLQSTYNIDFGGQCSLLKNKLKIALSCNSILASNVKGNVNSTHFKMTFNNTYNYPTVKLAITYILGAKLSGKRYTNSEIQDRM